MRNRAWLLLIGAAAALLLLRPARRSEPRPAFPSPGPAPADDVVSWRLLLVLTAAMLVLAGAAVAVPYWLQRREDGEVARALTGGDPARGPALITRYGCGGCHTVPWVAGADGKVAAPLAGMRQRVFIAGVLRNTPDNLVGWIVDPQAASPRSAMPRTGITTKDARDVAAYLYAN